MSSMDSCREMERNEVGLALPVVSHSHVTGVMVAILRPDSKAMIIEKPAVDAT